MATIPRLAGTAAGIGVSVQLLCGAIVAQIYGIFADGTVVPLVVTSVICALLALVSAVIPSVWQTPADGNAAIPPQKGD